MRVLVISDSHGNIERLKHVYGFAKEAGLGTIIHCGDWDNAQAAETARNVGVPVYSVLGNADVARRDEIVQVLKDAGVTLEAEILELDLPAGRQGLGGRKIMVSHFPGKLAEYIKSGKYDAAFHGHTHRRKEKMEGNTRVVNPGPLTGSNPSFVVYDTENNTVQFVDVAV